MRNVEGMLVAIAKKVAPALIANGVGDFEDALQETRLAFERIRETAPEEYWYHQTKCATISAIRKRYGVARKWKDARASGEGGIPDEDRLTLDERVSDRDRASVPIELADALAKVPERWRQVIVARYLEGRSVKECAAAFGVAPRTVVEYCSRGKKIASGKTTLEEIKRADAEAKRRAFESDPEKWLEKAREHKAKWRARNRGRLRDANREYYAENVDEIRARRKERRRAHAEEARQRARDYYAKNREKLRAYNREYYEKNRERVARRERERRAANREEINARRRENYAKNREAINEERRPRRREEYAANREKAAARWREYYAANRERMTARAREYYEANREKIAARARERYARKKAEREAAPRDPGALKNQTQPNEEQT